jgi:hypothetical protein
MISWCLLFVGRGMAWLPASTRTEVIEDGVGRVRRAPIIGRGDATCQ